MFDCEDSKAVNELQPRVLRYKSNDVSDEHIRPISQSPKLIEQQNWLSFLCLASDQKMEMIL
jgi:hypothetical protein